MGNFLVVPLFHSVSDIQVRKVAVLSSHSSTLKTKAAVHLQFCDICTTLHGVTLIIKVMVETFTLRQTSFLLDYCKANKNSKFIVMHMCTEPQLIPNLHIVKFSTGNMQEIVGLNFRI
jgi:hypothetical protein